jgi:lipopolysaccharide core galacturonosyltransferase RgtB
MKTSSQASRPESPGSAELPARAFLPTRQQFFFILLAYFALMLVSRSLISEVAGIDEADQIVLGQKLSWGYGPQPPLFTWLMMGCLRLFGYSIFSLTLLRESLLFVVFALTYLNARTLTGSHSCGLGAAVALQFYPSICWESQRELTHSILASAMILAMLWAFFRLQTGRWRPYLAFGGFAALAVLSKYNAALFCVSLLLAAFSFPIWRQRLLDWRMAAAFGLTFSILLPHALWILRHPDLAFSSVYKFHMHPTTPWWPTVSAGLRDWFLTAGAHLGPLLLVIGLLFWRPLFRERAFSLRNEGTRLLCRTFLILITLVVLSVALLRVTTFKDRWLQPIFVSLPILLLVALVDSLNAARLRAILVLGSVIAGVVAIVAPGRLLLTERLHKREILNAPFRQLAADLRPLVASADFIVSNDRWMAANVHLWFTDKLAITPDLRSSLGPRDRHCLLVWEVKPHDEFPHSLQEFAREFTGNVSLPAPVWLEETWKFHRAKKLRLGVVLLDGKEN